MHTEEATEQRQLSQGEENDTSCEVQIEEESTQDDKTTRPVPPNGLPQSTTAIKESLGITNHHHHQPTIGVLEEARAALEALDRLEQMTVDYILSDRMMTDGSNGKAVLVVSATAADTSFSRKSSHRHHQTHRERLLQQRVVALQAKTIQHTLKQHILPLLNAENSSRTQYLDSITCGTHEFTNFYNRLKEVKDFHRANPNKGVYESTLDSFGIGDLLIPSSASVSWSSSAAPAADSSNMPRPIVDEEKEKEMMEIRFSGQESLGRFVDLSIIFTSYQNLKGASTTASYIQYLGWFISPHAELLDIPRSTKLTMPYTAYLQELVNYFEDFIERAKPYLDVPSTRAEFLASFEKAWSEGNVSGWEDVIRAASANGNAEASETSPIYCSACQKYFAKESVYEAHKTGKKHIKAVQAAAQGSPSKTKADLPPPPKQSNGSASDKVQKIHDIAALEALVIGYANTLADIFVATKMNVERRLTLTEDERLAELEEDLVELAGSEADGSAGEEEDEEDDQIYNPLNLPLGFDGKPIPYWLYKLHGLGIKFPCEICGNFVYMGRKAFEEHFQEARHIHGMKCLGIPNTKAFHDVTRIADARALWVKMKAENRRTTAVEDAVEFEDEEGNVFNRKTYEDLKRQGLI